MPPVYVSVHIVWCPIAISMVSAAAGLPVGSRNTVARRRMHLRFVEACVRIATPATKLCCPMASLFLSGTACTSVSPIAGIIGLRLLRRKPGVTVTVISCPKSLAAHIFGSCAEERLLTRQRGLAPTPHLHEGVKTAHNDLRFPAHHDALLLQSLQADGHPLPSRTHHVGKVGVRKRGSDEGSVGHLDSIGINQMEQQMREPIGNRPRAEHLHEGGIALALERKTLDQADSERRNLHHQGAQRLARQLNDTAVVGGNARPQMNAGPEDVRTTDEVSGIPIGQRDLASRWRVIKHANPAALDEVDALMRCALAEKRLPAIEHASPAMAQHQFALAR